MCDQLCFTAPSVPMPSEGDKPDEGKHQAPVAQDL